MKVPTANDETLYDYFYSATMNYANSNVVGYLSDYDELVIHLRNWVVYQLINL